VILKLVVKPQKFTATIMMHVPLILATLKAAVNTLTLNVTTPMLALLIDVIPAVAVLTVLSPVMILTLAPQTVAILVLAVLM